MRFFDEAPLTDPQLPLESSCSGIECVQNVPVDVFKTLSHNPRNQIVDLVFKCDAYRKVRPLDKHHLNVPPTQKHIYWT